MYFEIKIRSGEGCSSYWQLCAQAMTLLNCLILCFNRFLLSCRILSNLLDTQTPKYLAFKSFHTALLNLIKLDKLGSLGSAAGLITEAQAIQKIEYFPSLEYQLIQIRHFLESLRKSSSIFQALTLFEKCFDSGGMVV